MDKHTLRRYIRELKQKQSALQLSLWSQKLAEALEQHPWFAEAEHVLLFVSLPDEPDTKSLLNKYSNKKNLYLPAVVGDDIEVRVFKSAEQLNRGAFDILEPNGDTLADLSVLDLVVTPGVAFDKEGHRLGRGRGYYDRLFARKELRAKRIGYAFPFQIVGAVPTEPYDRKMDSVLQVP
ncbi:MAG: 5-formyltetrahydrofolate cyclo-ligase [Bacteroidaceae bacterium]|nr:5-formyltetrahydrofolate cyclo-ligase [Bacteroidaceae bacterium]